MASTRRSVGTLTAVAAVLCMTACSLGPEVDPPEWAKVSLTSSSQQSLELLISQKFLVTEGSVQLMEFSTDTVSLPFEERYTLGAPARFFVRVTNITAQTASFRLRIFMEDRSWLDDEQIVAPGEKVEFVYRYDEPGING